MSKHQQALWDNEDLAIFRERVRKASIQVLDSDRLISECRQHWREVVQALAKAEGVVTDWILSTEPMPPQIFLERLRVLEAQVQMAEGEVRCSRGKLNAARAMRGRLRNERRIAIRIKIERYPLEEWAKQNSAAPQANGQDSEVRVETARVPAEQLEAALEEEQPIDFCDLHPPICGQQDPRNPDWHCVKKQGHRFDHRFVQKPELKREIPSAASRHAAIEPELEKLLESESNADESAESVELWPLCLDVRLVEAAYVGDRFAPHQPPKKPIGVKAFLWDGKYWIMSQSDGTAYEKVIEVLPLILLAEFAERFPGIALKLAPQPSHCMTAEDVLQYYTGVRLKVGRKEYAIAPAGEARRLRWRDNTSNPT